MSILHTIRKNGEGKTKSVRLTSRTAILAACLECMNFNQAEVERCTSPLCPLYPFRNRRATKGTREVSEKQKEAQLIAGKRLRESKQKEK